MINKTAGRLAIRFFVVGMACVFCALGLASPASASTLVVNGSQTIVQGAAGDDLANIKNIYQDANQAQDSGTLPLDPTVNAVGMKRMRFLRTDIYTDIDANGNFLPAPPGWWDYFTYELDIMLQRGVAPHVAAAANMPASFAQYGAAENWWKYLPQVDVMALYKSYVQQYVNYVAQRTLNAGVGSVVFEVSNEIDIADNPPPGFDPSQQNLPPPASPMAKASLAPLGAWGRFLWWIDPGSYNFYEWPPIDSNSYPFGGDMRRVEHAISPVQKIWADAVLNAKTWYAQHPDPSGRTVKIEIAGPATALFSFLCWNSDPTTCPSNPTIEERFLDTMFDPKTDAGQYNASLDYISFHYYGDFGGNPNVTNVWGRPPLALKTVTDRLRAKMVALGHPNVKFFISEWGPSGDMWGPTGTINYSNDGAAWTAAFLNEAVNDGVVMGSYLLVNDAMPGQPSGVLSLPSYMADINGVLYPKPVINVFKMFNMMTGTRNPVTLPTGQTDLGAFAASDKSSAGLLVYNYNDTFTTTNQGFQPVFQGLSFTGPVTVERYLIDASTSNLYAYLNNPSHPDPSLQKVESFPAVVDQSGNLALAPYTAGPASVTFWRVVPAAPAQGTTTAGATTSGTTGTTATGIVFRHQH